MTLGIQIFMSVKIDILLKALMKLMLILIKVLSEEFISFNVNMLHNLEIWDESTRENVTYEVYISCCNPNNFEEFFVRILVKQFWDVFIFIIMHTKMLKSLMGWHNNVLNTLS